MRRQGSRQAANASDSRGDECPDDERDHVDEQLNVRPSLLDEDRLEKLYVPIIVLLFLMMGIVVDRAVRGVDRDRRLLAIEANMQMRIDEPRHRKGEQDDECNALNEGCG